MSHPFGKDPLKFLRNNLLTLNGSLDDPPLPLIRGDGTILVKAVDYTQYWTTAFRHRRRKGLATLVPKSNKKWWTKPSAVMAILPANDDDDDAFPAYICPFRFDTLCVRTLGADADVMFTGDMDGCTFGIGIPNRDGGVRVGHANAIGQSTGDGKSDSDYDVQRQVQRGALGQYGAGSKLVDPSNYRTTVNRTHTVKTKRGPQVVTDVMGTKAITVGLRINNVWEFYYQHQVVDGGAQWREGLELVKLQ
jgi:hypothetical protein